MRLFSAKEKQTINILLTGEANSVAYLPINAYNDIFYREKTEFVASKMQLVFYVPNGNLLDHRRMLDIYYEILEISLLLDYLKKEGLLYQISMSSSNQLSTIGGFNKNGLQGVAMAIDPNIGQILLDSISKPIYVSQTLKDLANNNFLSLEGRALKEAKTQTRLSLLAVVLSIISIILGFIL